MKTKKEYTNKLNNNIITEKMLSDAIYSVNKRAKNYRDKEKEYRDKYRNSRYYTDKYNNEEKNREKKEEMYKIKEKLLELLQPSCIHVKIIKNDKKVRYYSYEPIYEKYASEEDKIIKRGEFYDRDSDEYIDFIDVYEEFIKKEYYLLYETAYGSFHAPLQEYNLIKYKLPIVEIDFTTKGDDINVLLSLPFIKKILDLINSGNYKLELEEELV